MPQYQQQQNNGKPPLPPRLRDYRVVGDRIDAFAMDYPGETCITTTYEIDTPIGGWVLFRSIASRRMPDGSEWVLGSGMAAIPYTVDEKTGNPCLPAPDAWEKGETASRGRALVAAGYTSSIEKAEELERAAEKIAAQEAREQATKAMQVAPMPEADPTPIKRPKPTKAERPSEFTHTAAELEEIETSKAAKVGVATEHASGQGETVEQAVGEAFGRAAKARAAEPAAEIASPNAQIDSLRVFPNDKAEAARLTKMPPPFRAFIEKMHGYAEQGETFEQIKARFGAAKSRMSEPEIKEARHQLAILKTRCEEIAAAAVDPALAEDVATELDALTEEERAFMAS